jgi:hypothetical protein
MKMWRASLKVLVYSVLAQAFTGTESDKRLGCVGGSVVVQILTTKGRRKLCAM